MQRWRFTFLVGALVLTMNLLACRSTNSKSSDGQPGAESDLMPYRTTRDDVTSLPEKLWSPTRRQAASGFYFLVGEYKLLAGDSVGAGQLFEAANNLDPNPFLAAKQITTDAMNGKSGEALLDARKMVLLYPKSAQLHFLYANILVRQGLSREALLEYETALDLDPFSEEIYLGLMDLHLVAEDITNAIVIAKQLCSQIPQSAQGWLRLAKLYLMNRQKRESLAPAERAFDMQPANPEATLIFALSLEANDQSKKAISLYENLYRLNPSNEQLIARMVDIYRSMGNLETSLDLLNELAVLPGGARPGVQLQRAIIFWELKRFKEAAALLNDLANDYPEQLRLQYLAGIGQERLKNWHEAQIWYAKIPESSEFWIFAQLRTAVILKELGKNQEAIAILSKLESNEKVDADVFTFSATVYAEQKNYSEAVAVVERGYKKFPTEHRLLFLKSVYLERIDRYEECISTLRTLLKIEPKNSAALNYLGYMYAERGENLKEALELVTEALRIKPNDGYYLDSLGWVYYQQKQYEEARKYLLRAKDIIPEEGVVLEHLGDVSLKSNERANAIEYFEDALKKNVDDKERVRIEKKLKDLRDKEDGKSL